MSSDQESLARVEKLLRSQSLGLGANFLRKEGTAKLQSSGEVSVFVTHLESFAMQTNELILVQRPDSHYHRDLAKELTGLIDDIGKLVHKYQAPHVCYIASLADQIHALRLPPTDGYRLSVIGPKEFFKYIFHLPENYWATVVSDIDPNYTAWRSFQKRGAFFLDRDGQRSPDSAFDLDSELRRWAQSSGPELPILLLGDRGSGKTWQLLKFCVEQHERSRNSPEVHSPAVYLNLKLAIKYLRDTRRSSLGFFGLLSEQGSSFAVKWNATMLQALLECRELIVCLDGLDEVEIQPTDKSAQEQFRRLVSMLPIGARFVVASRTTNFISFGGLFSLETWPGVTVEGSFRVLELAPFEASNLSDYTSSFVAASPENRVLDHLRAMFTGSRGEDQVTSAVVRCCRHPALLARMVEDVQSAPSIDVFELLRSAIEGALVDFNLQFERTRSLHLDKRGDLQIFDTPARLAFLSEIAWFMSERKIDKIDVNHLPARLKEMFGIDSESLRRDVRSQTVFELVHGSGLAESDIAGADREEMSAGLSAFVRFGLRLDEDVAQGEQDYVASSREPVEVPCKSRSVTQSYFLASYIEARLADARQIPGVTLEDSLVYLGRVRLDHLTAAILRHRLDIDRPCGFTLNQIAVRALNHIRELAGRGGCQIFAKSYRFLLENMETLGCISSNSKTLFDPWTPEIRTLAKGPRSLEDCEMVIVPSPRSPKIALRAGQVDVLRSNKPFLLSVHEITNLQFDSFITSGGKDWSVERVTRARSGGEDFPPSRFASRTNEYNLYFWEKIGRMFGPPRHLQSHPVVYVSWYMAQAFCNWLSVEDERERVWLDQDSIQRSATNTDVEIPGFRLPTASEWWWSAQGNHDEADYPWEVIPYFVPPSLLDVESQSQDRATESASAIMWFQKYRQAMKKVILDGSAQSSEVAYDDDVGPFGAIGLIGNVKEWVQDVVMESGACKAVVCGTTAHLGSDSFRIGYYATLFPENSNPDLGFRVARTLSQAELLSLQAREKEISSLADSLMTEFLAESDKLQPTRAEALNV